MMVCVCVCMCVRVCVVCLFSGVKARLKCWQGKNNASQILNKYPRNAVRLLLRQLELTIPPAWDVVAEDNDRRDGASPRPVLMSSALVPSVSMLVPSPAGKPKLAQSSSVTLPVTRPVDVVDFLLAEASGVGVTLQAVIDAAATACAAPTRCHPVTIDACRPSRLSSPFPASPLSSQAASSQASARPAAVTAPSSHFACGCIIIVLQKIVTTIKPMFSSSSIQL